MKKPRFLFPISIFMTGIATGIAIFSFLSFTGKDNSVPEPPPAELQGIKVISLTDANAMFKSYYSTASASTVPFKGFLVDTIQLNALKQLKSENATLAGFRIYPGKDAANNPVSIVVGVNIVNNNWVDATGGRIYKTNAAGSGPCPTVCDNSSQITKN